MTLKSVLKNICESIGRDNNPAYTVVAIATAKGIFRPLFTIMDKKESPETKKYTALREGVTELIAIPTYLACGYLAGKGADLFKDPNIAKKAKHNLRFAGVCLAALVVIPGLCSIAVKPFTDAIFNKNKKQEPARIDLTSEAPKIDVKLNNENKKITQNSIYNNYAVTTLPNNGMRVG